MRVRLNAIEITDGARRALNAHFGKPGLATRDDVRSWADAIVNADLETICDDYERAEKQK
jgi:hypothetical protein